MQKTFAYYAKTFAYFTSLIPYEQQSHSFFVAVSFVLAETAAMIFGNFFFRTQLYMQLQ